MTKTTISALALLGALAACSSNEGSSATVGEVDDDGLATMGAGPGRTEPGGSGGGGSSSGGGPSWHENGWICGDRTQFPSCGTLSSPCTPGDSYYCNPPSWQPLCGPLPNGTIRVYTCY